MSLVAVSCCRCLVIVAVSSLSLSRRCLVSLSCVVSSRCLASSRLVSFTLALFCYSLLLVHSYIHLLYKCLGSSIV